MELEQVINSFVPAPDRRPHLPEPPPVRLLTIADAHLPAPAGAEIQLDSFYQGILHFDRDARLPFPTYRAENFRILFDVLEPPIHRDDLRPLRIEVPELHSIQQTLIEGDIEHVRQRGISPGHESLLLLDPAGNWVEIAGRRDFR